ncbi:MAG: N-acetyltransferase [Pseudomonadota bacterium]
MSRKHTLRACFNSDLPALEPLYRAAFPDEDLMPLLRDLSACKESIYSQIAIINGDIAGHVVFTMCNVDTNSSPVALLGPLCVLPERQKRGVGSSLVRSGIEHCREQSIALVLVLGDPTYYGRFGFRSETGVSAPFSLPEEWKDAWQSVKLNDHSTRPRGKLVVPVPWRDRALWGP